MGKVSAHAYRATGEKVSLTTLVGEENFELRIRSLATGHFDMEYRSAMPGATIEVADEDEVATTQCDCIFDTGADISFL